MFSNCWQVLVLFCWGIFRGLDIQYHSGTTSVTRRSPTCPGPKESVWVGHPGFLFDGFPRSAGVYQHYIFVCTPSDPHTGLVPSVLRDWKGGVPEGVVHIVVI